MKFRFVSKSFGAEREHCEINTSKHVLSSSFFCGFYSEPQLWSVGRMAQQTSASKEIFVGGTKGISKREICEHFQSYGIVSSVRLAFDRFTGRCRGFGVVQFQLESSAQQALLSGRQHNIAGRHVTVQPARAASRLYTPCSTSSKPQSGPDTSNSGHVHIQIRPYAEQTANSTGRQPQHRHVSAHPASPTLLDICHEVPTLPELLNMDDQKALSAASRSFRTSFIAKIQVVTVTTEEDLALVNQSWPLLNMVILHMHDRQNPSFRSDRTLACVHVSATVSEPASAPNLLHTGCVTYEPDSERYGAIFMIKPLHTSASAASVSLAARQLVHHLLTKWPKLTSFSLILVKLPAAGVAITAQLAKGDCSSLAHLSLCHCGLATLGCLFLSRGNWPALRKLHLANNGINAQGMALLANAKWPKLRSLELSYNPTLDAEAMTHLSAPAAKWPLESLRLSHMPVSAALTAELAQLHFSTLTSVTLTKTGHIAAAVSELARADWPVLSSLNLGHNALDAAAMQHLCRIHMPALSMLILNNATIAGEGACWLAQGSWPRLKIPVLAYNQLDAEAARHIGSGVWPQLRSLSLEENLFGDDGLQQLTKGNWPLLDSLIISLNMLKRMTLLLSWDLTQAACSNSSLIRFLHLIH